MMVPKVLIAKFRVKLKKVGKTTRPFRYDLNQIPYDYTVEVRNRFKGLDLIDRLPDELWNEVHDTVQETGIRSRGEKPLSADIRNFPPLGTFSVNSLTGVSFVTLYRRQGSRPSPWKRNANKQNACLGRPYK